MFINQDNRFNEAFFKTENYCIDVDELKKLYSDDPVQFDLEYRDNLFCPDCKKAHLILAFGEKRQYLKTWQDNSHTEDCPYSPDVGIAKKDQVQKYAKANPQTIENGLRSLLHCLGKDRTEIQNKTKESSEKSPFVFTSNGGKKTITKVYIQRQKIINGKNGFSYDVEKYYYGKVLIEVVEYTKDIQLKIYSNNKKKPLICSVFVSKNDNLSEKIDKFKKNKEDEYRIAFFGQMVQSRHENPFNNLYIYDKHYIAFTQ
jgi:hypothetical protein